MIGVFHRARSAFFEVIGEAARRFMLERVEEVLAGLPDPEIDADPNGAYSFRNDEGAAFELPPATFHALLDSLRASFRVAFAAPRDLVKMTPRPRTREENDKVRAAVMREMRRYCGRCRCRLLDGACPNEQCEAFGPGGQGDHAA